jgi:hypothetical protein
MTSQRLAHAAVLAAACVGLTFATPASASAQATGEARQQSRQVSTAEIAAQIGAKLSPAAPAELLIGASASGSLADSAKVATFGASGLHPGARVTIMRIGPDRLRVEVDEMDPVPLTKKFTVKVDGEGRLTRVSP